MANLITLGRRYSNHFGFVGQYFFDPHWQGFPAVFDPEVKNMISSTRVINLPHL
jgi:hypothetical protein